MGNETAMCQLGEFYLRGINVPQDVKKAMDLFQTASARCFHFADFLMAKEYKLGIRVPKNLKKSIFHYKKSAEDGDIESICSLGELYLEITGQEQDIQKGFDYLHKAAEKGYPRACYALGSLYENGTYCSIDPLKAIQFYKMAADKGDANAQAALKRFEVDNTIVSEEKPDPKMLH
jgi:TPR repeat protein